MRLYRNLTWRGLFYGASDSGGTPTNFVIQNVEGLIDLPAVRAVDYPRPGQHGDFSGQDYSDGRTVTVTLGLRGDDQLTMLALTQQIIDQFQIGDTYPLGLVRLQPDGTYRTWTVYGKVRKRAVPDDLSWESRFGQAVIQFWCPDPRVYMDAPTQLGVALLSAGGSGHGFPQQFPLSFGGTAAGGTSDVVITNTGSVEVGPTITISGQTVAVGDLIVQYVEGGTQLEFQTLTMQPGDVLVIDNANKSAMLNGSVDVRGTLTTSSRWLMLPKGANTVRFLAANYDSTINAAVSGHPGARL